MKTELNEKQIKTLEKLIHKVIKEKAENKTMVNEGKVKKSLTEQKINKLETLIKKVLDEQMVSNGITSEGLGDYLHGALKGVKDVVKNDVKSVKDGVSNVTNKIGDKVKSVKDGVKSRIDQVKVAGEKANQEAETAKTQLEGENKLKEILELVKEFNLKFETNLVVRKAKVVTA